MIASDTAEADTLDQDSDYDGAWKEALSLHLPEFLSKYFPSIFAAIDWMVRLRRDLDTRFDVELIEFETEIHALGELGYGLNPNQCKPQRSLHC